MILLATCILGLLAICRPAGLLLELSERIRNNAPEAADGLLTGNLGVTIGSGRKPLRGA